MNTHLGKSHFEQTVSPVGFLGLGDVLSAEIADGDFRTYVLLCQWAWQEHAESATPFSERTYAEMAQLHPGHRRPTPETVRGRIYRLVRAGLVRRERVGRTTWRTYPLIEDSTANLRMQQDHTHDCNTGLYPQSLAGQSAHPHGCVALTHPEAVSVQQKHRQGPDCAPVTYPENTGGQDMHTQALKQESACVVSRHLGQVTVPLEHRQTGQCTSTTHAASMGVQQVHNQNSAPAAVTGQPAHTQSTMPQVSIPSSGDVSARVGWNTTAHPNAVSSRASASVLTGTDSLSYSSSHPGRDHQSVSTDGTDANPVSHKVLSLVTVPPGYEELAVTLATMAPQGMNYEGIEECLAQPELTQAWYDYVQRTEETIHNPAAYIRHGVRSGRKPPTLEAKKAQKQTHDPNDFGWDDPTIPAELYIKYAVPGYMPPHLRNSQGTQSTH